MFPNTMQTIVLPMEGPLALKRGGAIERLEVAYETYGTLAPAKDNAIFICPPLTMDAHASDGGDPGVEPGWWNFLVGPGKAVDTRRFFVVCCSNLGGCRGTTGPTSLKPDGSGPWLTEFPLITVEDMVQVQRLLLRHLGVERLRAVIGGSLGGIQALEWAVQHPDLVDRVVAIATGHRLSPQGLGFDIIGRQAITSDPEWKDGRYAPEDVRNITGLSIARMTGHITYISRQVMDRKFGRRLQEGLNEQAFNTRFAVESFLRHQGEKFQKRFDPNSYLYLTKAVDLYDLQEGYDSLAASLARARARFLVLSVSSDWLFPPSCSLELVMALVERGLPVSYASLETDIGHDAFLIEDGAPGMDGLVAAFLET